MHKEMTYGHLLAALYELSPSQLTQLVSVWDGTWANTMSLIKIKADKISGEVYLKVRDTE